MKNVKILFHDSPEQIQKCLHCRKRECTNCYYTQPKIARQNAATKRYWERKKKERKREREAKDMAEWEKIVAMLGAGIPRAKIGEILGHSKLYLYKGKHKERFKAYRAKIKEERENGNAD